MFVESLDGAFENVCELDLVFHFDEVRSTRLYFVCTGSPYGTHTTLYSMQAHHILAEVIQGGLVLETNVNEIDRAGECAPTYPRPEAERDDVHATPNKTLSLSNASERVPFRSPFILEPRKSVQEAARARKESYASANPLSLGGGGAVGSRSAGLQTPLGWLTGRLAGVGAR